MFSSPRCLTFKNVQNGANMPNPPLKYSCGLSVFCSVLFFPFCPVHPKVVFYCLRRRSISASDHKRSRSCLLLPGMQLHHPHRLMQLREQFHDGSNAQKVILGLGKNWLPITTWKPKPSRMLTVVLGVMAMILVVGFVVAMCRPEAVTPALTYAYSGVVVARAVLPILGEMINVLFFVLFFLEALFCLFGGVLVAVLVDFPIWLWRKACACLSVIWQGMCQRYARVNQETATTKSCFVVVFVML